jgi:cytoskeletal protein CcmA (bactofilin family)
MLKIFRKGQKSLNSSNSNISSLVREGNDLFSDELILLDEKLSGNLFCAEKIVVEQNGILAGNIISKLCIVSGTITGNILSTGQMEIKSTAVIKGNIQSALLNIEPGAVINGRVTIAKDSAAITNLSRKINEHSTDEYLSAKQTGELAALNHLDVPVNIEVKQKEPTITQVQPIKTEEPSFVSAPAIKPAPPLLAASAPKAAEPIKPEDGNNQRWW